MQNTIETVDQAKKNLLEELLTFNKEFAISTTKTEVTISAIEEIGVEALEEVLVEFIKEKNIGKTNGAVLSLPKKSNLCIKIEPKVIDAFDTSKHDFTEIHLFQGQVQDRMHLKSPKS